MTTSARSVFARTALLVFLSGCVALVVLVAGGTEVATLLRAGTLGPSARLIEERFGPDALLAQEVGYDGQQFYAIADQLPDLSRAAPHLDDPQYRLQRILGPALASVVPAGDATVVALFLTNVIGLAIACGALAVLAARRGLPTWTGYLALVPLAPALAFMTSEALAFGLAFAGIALLDLNRWAWATMAFTAGALARESVAVVALACAGGVALEAVRRSGVRSVPRHHLVVAVLPAATCLLWALYVRSVVPAGHRDERIQPLGLLDASPTGLGLGLLVIMLGLIGAWRWRSVPAVWPVPLAFAAMCLVYFDLLFRWQAILRVSAPALVFGLMALAGGLGRTSQQNHGEVTEPGDAPARSAGGTGSH